MKARINGKITIGLFGFGVVGEGLHQVLKDIQTADAEIKKIEDTVGIIDILLNNAGINHREPLENISEENWQRVIDINLNGAFRVSKAVVKGMIKNKKGKIINICSMQSEISRPTIAAYAASKGGIKMLTRAMAVDWAKHGIQVNGIGPGYFKTELTKALHEDPEFDSWLCARTPSNRWGNLEELIGALIYLSSSASNYVNGQIIYVDGGLLAAV
jgi:gluconate 5-dehydrogenase